MAIINVLDQNTINQIAAGEVIERPASVVKELIENSLDSGASAVTCEIKGGGMELIRITDNGSGIEQQEIRKAFLSHATSKIKTADDLIDVISLGFRGEALASIASVSTTEMLTKPRGEVMGTRYVVESGTETAFHDAGCPDGTTVIVRNLFSNVPVRRKFLKSAITEASAVSDLIDSIALSHPSVSVKYINNGRTVLFTSGNGSLKDVVYGIYGRDITSQLIQVSTDTVSGLIAKPVVARANRSFEMFFVNGRHIRNNILSKALEEAYAPYLMQHKYPFAVLNIKIPPENVDVNVHPTKQEVRFEHPQDIFNEVYKCITDTLKNALMVPDAAADLHEDGRAARQRFISDDKIQKAPEPFELSRRALTVSASGVAGEIKTAGMASGVMNTEGVTSAGTDTAGMVYDGIKVTGIPDVLNAAGVSSAGMNTGETGSDRTESVGIVSGDITPAGMVSVGMKAAGIPDELNPAGVTSAETNTTGIGTDRTENAGMMPDEISDFSYAQMVFETAKNELSVGTGQKTDAEFRRGMKEGYHIVGQVFNTYWIVERGNSMYLIDQHAAHEKILYEKIVSSGLEGSPDTQMLSPSVILSFTPSECDVISGHFEIFEKIGFELEYYSGNEFLLRGVPLMLYGIDPKDLISEIVSTIVTGAFNDKNILLSQTLKEKLATCACKAAVKGNTRLSETEARKLIDDLLKLENPFNCPHGRPVIIEMTKSELEKKFKRII